MYNIKSCRKRSSVAEHQLPKLTMRVRFPSLAPNLVKTMSEQKKKYGLWTAIAMIVGVVIGCGIFIKSGKVLQVCGGNVYLACLAWLIGGLIMISGGFCFAKFASKVSKFNGLVDYVEVSSNRKTTYEVAYFTSMLYFPIIGSNVAIIGTSYLLEAFNIDVLASENAYLVYLIAFVFITFFLLLNYFSPLIASRFQISSMVIKLIPIFIIIIVALFGKFIIGDGHSFIDPFINSKESTVNSFGEAIKITAFAYDGWICATSLNAEMKNPKKDLPKALVIGTIAITVFYLLFFVGLVAIVGVNETLAEKDAIFVPIRAFVKIFGNGASILFVVFLFLSCVGNLNAMTICTSRGLISMAVRGEGFAPKQLGKPGKKFQYPFAPYLLTYILMIIYLVVWALARNYVGVFKYFNSMDEIVCTVLYASFIIIYVYIMKEFKELNFFYRFVMPIIATIGSIIFVLCGSGLFQLIFDHDITSLYSFFAFVVLAIIIIIPGEIVYYKDSILKFMKRLFKKKKKTKPVVLKAKKKKIIKVKPVKKKKEKLNFNKRLFLLPAAIIVIGLFIFGSLYDLEISKTLYIKGNMFSPILASIATLPCGIVLGIILGSLFKMVTTYEFSKRWQNILLAFISFAGLIAGAYYVGSFSTSHHAYSLPFYFNFIFGFMVLIPSYLFGYYYYEKMNHKHLFSTYILLALTFFFLVGSIELLKMSFPRVRYSALVVIGDGYFTPWYKPDFNIINELVGKAISIDEAKSFPSGHSNVALFASFLLMFIPRLFDKLKNKEAEFFYIGFIFYLLIAFSRIVGGAHYLTDTMFSGILGLLVFCISNEIYLRKVI